MKNTTGATRTCIIAIGMTGIGARTGAGNYFKGSAKTWTTFDWRRSRPGAPNSDWRAPGRSWLSFRVSGGGAFMLKGTRMLSGGLCGGGYGTIEGGPATARFGPRLEPACGPSTPATTPTARGKTPL